MSKPPLCVVSVSNFTPIKGRKVNFPSKKMREKVKKEYSILKISTCYQCYFSLFDHSFSMQLIVLIVILISSDKYFWYFWNLLSETTSYAVGTKLGPPRWPLLEIPLYFFKIVPVIKNSVVQYGFYRLIIHLKRFNLFNLIPRVSFKGEKLLSFSFFSWKERNPGDEGVIYPHKFFLSTHSILKKQS